MKEQIENYKKTRESICIRFNILLRYKYKLLHNKELPKHIEEKINENGSFTSDCAFNCTFFVPENGRHMRHYEKLPLKCFDVDIKKAKKLIEKDVEEFKKMEHKKEQDSIFAKNNPNKCFDCGTKVEHQPNFMMDASSWRCPKCNSSYTKYTMEQENILHRG